MLVGVAQTIISGVLSLLLKADQPARRAPSRDRGLRRPRQGVLDDPLPGIALRVRARLVRPSRRALLAGAGATIWARPIPAGEPLSVRIRNGADPVPVSPLIYGSGEIGTLDGGPPSAELDRAAGVSHAPLRRQLRHELQLDQQCLQRRQGLAAGERRFPEPEPRPAPRRARRPRRGDRGDARLLAGDGRAQHRHPAARELRRGRQGRPRPGRPSRPLPALRAGLVGGTARGLRARGPARRGHPHLLARLVARYGPASGATGIRGYILDNEPGPVGDAAPAHRAAPVRIADLLARSIKAARAIKAIDPDAWVIGPASWGATGMVNLQNAPDWNAYRQHGSFLAPISTPFVRLGARGQAPARCPRRALVPVQRAGTLFRTEDPALAGPLLDAPRSLTEGLSRGELGLAGAARVERGRPRPAAAAEPRTADGGELPGTRTAVTEYNYGGAGQLASGLALADALARFARPEMLLTAHWGSLAGWLGTAFRLYRNYDGRGGRFPDNALPVEPRARPDGLTVPGRHRRGEAASRGDHPRGRDADGGDRLRATLPASRLSRSTASMPAIPR